MPDKIEEIFNECFERLLAGESLESCIYRYPEHAQELDIMLRTAFDVKRKAFPIQPRPEFKYWARVRMDGVQDYLVRHPHEEKPSIFNWRRSWALALSVIVVIVLATGGTAAASSDAMPDQPLYTVKLAVEQAQVALTFSDADKAELYGRLVEKRAQEIATMASQGKTEKVITTTARMNYELEQAVLNLQKYESAETDTTQGAGDTASAPAPGIRNVAPAPPSGTTDTDVNNPPTAPAVTPSTPATTPWVTPVTPSITPSTTPVTPSTTPSTIPVTPETTPSTTPTTSTTTPPVTPQVTPDTSANTPQGTTSQEKTTSGKPPKAVIRPLPAAVNRAKTSIDNSNIKSITVLQNALDKAPDTVKPAIKEMIEKARQANLRLRTGLKDDSDDKPALPVNKPNTGPLIKPRLDNDKKNPLAPVNKPKSTLTTGDNALLSDEDNSNDDTPNGSNTGTSTTGSAGKGTHNNGATGAASSGLSKPTVTNTSNISVKSGATSITNKTGSIK